MPDTEKFTQIMSWSIAVHNVMKATSREPQSFANPFRMISKKPIFIKIGLINYKVASIHNVNRP